MKSTKNLILYKNFENGKLFYNMAWIMENYENEYYNREDIEALLYECFNQLSELAVSHGFKGNLCIILLHLFWSITRTHTAVGVRSGVVWKAPSIRLHCMILRS